MSIELRAVDRSLLGMVQELLEVACEFDPAKDVAEEKAFEPGPNEGGSRVYGAFDRANLCGIVVTSQKWIRLLAVHPRYRNHGIALS